MVVMAVVGSGVYKFFLLLHILSAIIGFGGVLLNPVYFAESRRRGGREGLAVSEANFAASSIAEFAIYGVFVFGLITVFIGDPTVKFSQGWLSAAMLLYIIAVVIARAVLVPTHRKINRLTAELIARPAGVASSGPGGPPPEVAELQSLNKRVARFGGLLSLLFLIVLFLMVVKPGLHTTL
jgi:uncharacterized membrane protein